MKFIDIAVQFINSVPKGTMWITQDLDGEVRFWSGKSEFAGGAGFWVGGSGLYLGTHGVLECACEQPWERIIHIEEWSGKQETDATQQMLDPIQIRDRVGEIDRHLQELQTERARLIAQLRNQGFVLSSEV